MGGASRGYQEDSEDVTGLFSKGSVAPLVRPPQYYVGGFAILAMRTVDVQ